MGYKAINRDDGGVYLQRIPENATDKPLTIIEMVVLELAEKVENLQNKYTNNKDYDKKRFIEILDSYKNDSYAYATLDIVFDELKELFNKL